MYHVACTRGLELEEEELLSHQGEVGQKAESVSLEDDLVHDIQAAAPLDVHGSAERLRRTKEQGHLPLLESKNLSIISIEGEK